MRPSSRTTIIASGTVSKNKRYGSSSMASCSSCVIGQPHAEGGARRAVLDPDPSAMGVDGELAEREPEPAPAAGLGATLSFHLHEGVEDALAHRGRNARARVGDAQLHAAGDVGGRELYGRLRRRVSD